MCLIWRTLGSAIVTWYKSDHSSADYYRLNYKCQITLSCVDNGGFFELACFDVSSVKRCAL